MKTTPLQIAAKTFVMAVLLGGCVTANSTVKKLDVQNGQIRNDIHLQQILTRQLQQQKQKLQNDIASAETRKTKLESAPPSPQNDQEINQVKAEIKGLKEKLSKLSGQYNS